MNLKEIFECLQDGYEQDSYGRTTVPAALAQELILQAAGLNKPKWINSETRLPEIVEHGSQKYSEDVLIYDDGNFRVAYLWCCKESFLSGDVYHRLIYDDYDCEIEGTHWMPLPKPPKV